MKSHKAVYAASLDPITFGHLDVIKRMAPRFDEFIVIVAVDPRKNYTFSMNERVQMAKDATAHLTNVRVETCIGQYVVRRANELGASVNLRGIRDISDLESERRMAEENSKICPHIETLWVPCSPELHAVSSSMVKSHVGADPTWEAQAARSAPAAVVAKLKEKYILSRARKHWAELMSILDVTDEKKSCSVFDGILARYSEPHRHYHTMEHIVSMLDEAERESIKDTNLLLAIWFHDVIYDTRSHDNEEASAMYLITVAQQLGIESFFAMKASDYIRETKHSGNGGHPHLEGLFLDLDLAILGAEETEFDRYDVNIRKEYEWVDQAAYRTGRGQILQRFLDHPQIFSTLLFQVKYETQARKNLARAIERLRE